MKSNTLKIVAVLLVSATLSACSGHRISSNIDKSQIVDEVYAGEVVISEGDIEAPYTEIAPLEVTLKKHTAFHPSPTRAQANQALQDKARQIGANAVINTTYKSGVGMTTWGYMKATGTAVKTEQ